MPREIPRILIRGDFNKNSFINNCYKKNKKIHGVNPCKFFSDPCNFFSNEYLALCELSDDAISTIVAIFSEDEIRENRVFTIHDTLRTRHKRGSDDVVNFYPISKEGNKEKIYVTAQNDVGE